MHRSQLIVVLGACLLASGVESAVAGDPFNDPKMKIEMALRAPGSGDMLKRVFGDIDTSLDCFTLSNAVAKQYLDGKFTEDEASVYGVLTWLSAQAVTEFQTMQQIPNDTLISMGALASQRYDADPIGFAEKCVALNSTALRELVELQKRR